VRQARRGEVCFGAAKAARFSVPVPSTARFERLLPVLRADFAIPSPLEGVILGWNPPRIWRMSVEAYCIAVQSG